MTNKERWDGGARGEGMGEPLSFPYKGGGLLERRGLFKSGGRNLGFTVFSYYFHPPSLLSPQPT